MQWNNKFSFSIKVFIVAYAQPHPLTEKSVSAPGIVHNFLWYTLKAEINALSFGFDYHILTKINNISIQAKSVLLVTDMPNFS